MTPGEYFRKMGGTGHGAPPAVRWSEIAWSWLGSFLGIGALALIGHWVFTPQDQPFLLASFGASAMLVYGAIRSPLAQPRNLLGGHILSAIVGVTCWKWLGHIPYLAEALSVSTAVAVMHATRTLHPPGGATALLAIIGSNKIHAMGYYYVLIPAMLGPLVLLIVALLVNNLSASRQYPESWF